MTRPVTSRTAALAVLAAAALFGTSGTVVALFVPNLPAPAVAASRLLLGSLGLLAFAAARGRAPAVARLLRRPMVWVMGLAVAGYQVFFFLGTANAGVATGTLVSLALAPFLAGLLGWVMRAGAPGWVWAASTVLAVAGMTALTTGGGGGSSALGLAAAAAAGGCYACYTVLGVRLARERDEPVAVLAAAFAIGAAILVPGFLVSGSAISAAGIGAIVWLGFVATTLGYLLFGVGLRVLPPGNVATFNLLEPVVAMTLGLALLGESLRGRALVGSALILGGLALLAVRRAPSRAVESEVVS